jgi:hypothetical protein
MMKPVGPEIERYRNKNAEMVLYGKTLDEYNGMFTIPIFGNRASVIISNGQGWEHVSVSFKTRCPKWDEMCYIKDLFFNEDEVVVQYHPKKSEYVNLHNNCLHMWRCIDVEMPTPPNWMVL